ncbi:MAG TPA: hypothetical protein VGG28_34265 [Kofleriaceae bacterium]|jgi:hypothetical protein
MRNTSLWIATSLAVALVGCKSKGSTESKPSETKQPEAKPAAGAAPAAGAGTFTCKRNDASDGSDSSCPDSTDHFDGTVPVMHVTYRTGDLPKSGDTYVIQWIAADVGSAAPANTVIATVNQAVGEIPAGANSYTVNGSLTKPNNGWPVGKYRVEIKLGDKLVTTANFSIQ